MDLLKTSDLHVSAIVQIGKVSSIINLKELSNHLTRSTFDSAFNKVKDICIGLRKKQLTKWKVSAKIQAEQYYLLVTTWTQLKNFAQKQFY